MNRCIHCERCVRFCSEVTKTNELLMVNRGWKKELALADDSSPLNSDYQGCLADLCPVGALTFNDFRFKKRVWFLTSRPSLCERCSQGCNLLVGSEHGVIYRTLPNNGPGNRDGVGDNHLLCDQGRLAFRQIEAKKRWTTPTLLGQENTWSTILYDFVRLTSAIQRVLMILGSDSTNEEGALLTQTLKNLFPEQRFTIRYYTGQSEIQTSNDDGPIDQNIKRKDQTPNTKGMNNLRIAPLFEEDLSQGYDVAILFKGALLDLSGLGPIVCRNLYLMGAIFEEDISLITQYNPIRAILPGLTTFEKSGSYTRWDGLVQPFSVAIPAPKNCRPIENIIKSAASLVREL
jgi:NADH-quinone oxidoreductase subunit G